VWVEIYQKERSMKRTQWIIGSIVLGLLVVSAPAATIFSDDFAGADGSPLDAGKWVTSGSASIQGGAGVLSGATQWANTSVSSTTGADLTVPGQTATYTCSHVVSGYYMEGNVGVQGLVDLYFKPDAYGDAFVVSVGGNSLGVLPFGARTASHTVSIALTPTTYTISVTTDANVTNTLAGSYTLPAGYTGGAWFFRTQNNAGWTSSSASIDNVRIDVVPEPITVSLLIGGVLFGLRRRRA
jgi:hypothetical protein